MEIAVYNSFFYGAYVLSLVVFVSKRGYDVDLELTNDPVQYRV